MVEQFQALLRGEVVTVGKLEQAFEIVRLSPHAHVVAVLGTLRNLKLEPILCTRNSRNRDARRRHGGRTYDCSLFQIGDGTQLKCSNLYPYLVGNFMIRKHQSTPTV